MKDVALFEEKIFEQILNLDKLNQEKYENLVNDFILYNKNKYDFNILFTEFCKDLPIEASTIVNFNLITSIKFSSNLLKKGPDQNKTLQLTNLLQTLNTISHEFAHAIDYSENIKSHNQDKNYRNFKGELYMNCSLFKNFELTSDINYYLYSQMLYFCSREECFARHFACLEIIDFCKKFKNYTELKYPENTKFLKDASFLLDYSKEMQKEFINSLTIQLKYKQKCENQVKEDYKYISEKLLKKEKFSFLPSKKIKNKKLLIHHIGSLSIYDEFFNQEIAEKFLKYSKKRKDIVTCVNILQNRNFQDKNQDREEIKKVLKNYNTELLL